MCVLDVNKCRWVRPLFDGSFEHEMHAAVVVSSKLLAFGAFAHVLVPCQQARCSAPFGMQFYLLDSRAEIRIAL